MADNKKSFVAYADWIESFEMLEDAEAGKLIKHLLRYVNDQNPVIEDRLLKIAFQPIKTQLKRDLNKYEEVRKKRIEAGKKGGKITQRKAKQANAKSVKQKQANQAVNVNDNVTVNVNDNVIKRESKLSPKIALAYDLLVLEKQTELETFLMQNKKLVKNWDDLVERFNNSMEIEISSGKIEYEVDQLLPRFRNFVKSWIQNQNKYAVTPKPDSYESGKLTRF